MENKPINTILQLATLRGWNQQQLASYIGVDSQNITNWKRRGIPTDKLVQIAQLLGISVEDILSGQGLANHLNPGDDVGFVIKRYDAGGSMGRGVLLKDQPGEIESIHVNNEWAQKNIRYVTSKNNLCLVTGFGDSMQPMFNPGDPLIIDTGVQRVDHDGVYFFRIGDEGFIKRLQRIPGQGILAISENKAYRDWTITPDMEFGLFGKIIKVWEGKSL